METPIRATRTKQSATLRRSSYPVCLALALLIASSCATAMSAPSPTAGTRTEQIAVVMAVALKTSNLGKAAELGIERIEKDFGLTVSVSDSLAPADMVPTLRDYAARDFDLIISQGTTLLGPALEVSAEYPNTKFVIVNGNQAQPPNLASVDFAYEQAGFMAGVVAGYATKTNRVVGLGSIQIPPIERLLAGFEQGVATSNPEAEVITMYTGSFTDVVLNKQAALAEISQGADVIYSLAADADPGVFQATDEKGVMAIGHVTDVSDLGPKSVITSVEFDYASVIYDATVDFLNGQFEPAVQVYGVEQNVFDMAPYRHLPPDVVEKSQAMIEQVKAGTIPVSTTS
jgi:basic membrane protein A